MTEPERTAEHQQAVREENRRLRYLRFLVDLALIEISRGTYTKAQAEKVVENIRSQALQLFPGKELAFDLIYRPRFRRVIAATFQLH
ncbi:MAG: hypothetical protein ACOC6L_00835 [Thermodesulfobacteriota bacterium]